MAKRRTQRQKALAIEKAVRLGVIILLSTVFLISSVMLIRYMIRSHGTAMLNRKLTDIYESTELPEGIVMSAPSPDFVPEMEHEQKVIFQAIGEMSAQAKKLYELNSDYVAWLNIPGIINLPVVYRNNEYYLTHDFYGNDSDSGTIFLDESHPLRAETQYLLLHGHDMYDDSMFAYITQYRKMDFIKEHPYLTLNTLYANDYYQIIGTVFVSEEEMVPVAGLLKPSFESESAFNDFITGLRVHALHFTNEEITPDTPLLALSTCYKDGRILAYFKRIDSQKS